MKLRPRITFEPKFDIPDGFYLIQDSNEQKPLFKKSLPWIVQKPLGEGDYSILGFENQVAIERKALNDLYGSLGKGRERFEKELERLLPYTWKGLLIEGSEQDIFSRIVDYSGLHPNSLYHSLASLETKYLLHIYYAPTRKDGKWWVMSRMIKLYGYLRQGKI